MTRITPEAQLSSGIAAAVRGSEALRQDIADEITDHLVCHADEAGPIDATSAGAQAIEAFGDPNEVVRELRRVHMGDWIMFQKLMVVSMVVIVAGMAVSSYFSWSANRQMAHELAEANRQMGEHMAEANRRTGEQIALLTKQFASLSKIQEMNCPPTMQITCYTLPGKRPAAGCEVKIESMRAKETLGSLFSNTYRTDEQGHIDTGPLPTAVYMLSGKTVQADGGVAGAVAGRWTRVVRLQQFGVKESVELCVGSSLSHTLQIEVPAGITWDPKRMRAVRLSIESNRGPRILGHTSGTQVYSSIVASLEAPTNVAGLIPGSYSASVYPPLVAHSGQPDDYERKAVLARLDVEVPDTSGSVKVSLPNEKAYLRGFVYDGSRDKPVANAPIRVVWSDKYHPSVPAELAPGRPAFECVRTDAKGRFGAMGGRACRYTLLMDHKTPDGKPARLVATLDRGFSLKSRLPWEIDVSKLAVVRLKISGRRALERAGIDSDDLMAVDWSRELSGRPYRSEGVWPFFGKGPVYIVAKEDGGMHTMLMFEGEYVFYPRAETWRAGDIRRRASATSSGGALPKRSSFAIMPRRRHEIEAAVRMTLSGGQTYDVQFDLAKIYTPKKKASSAPPLTLETVKLCRKVEGFGKYDEIKPLILPVGKQTQTVLYCEYKNPGWVRDPQRNKGYVARLSLSASVMGSKGVQVFLHARNDDIRVESQRTKMDVFLQQPIMFPSTLPEGEYNIQVTLKDLRRGTISSKTLGPIALKSNP